MGRSPGALCRRREPARERLEQLVPTREPAAVRGTVSVITHTVPVPGTIRRHDVRASVR